VYDTVSDLAFEVIVVDNASTDGSPDMVRHRFPQVRLLTNTENVGFARANNQAIRTSRGRYVLLLNSDVLALEGTLNRMVEFMDHRPEVGALGCELLNEDGSIQHFPKGKMTLTRELGRMLYVDELLAHVGRRRRRDDQAREVDRIKGACMLLRRETIAAVGLMEEHFFMFAEEDDWCLRIRQGGWKIYFLPEVAVIHFGGQSVKQIHEEMFLQLHRSKVAFFRKHYGRGATLALKGVYLLGYGGRIVGGALLSLACPAFKQRVSNYRRLMVELPNL
jgi:hypothetical protein